MHILFHLANRKVPISAYTLSFVAELKHNAENQIKLQPLCSVYECALIIMILTHVSRFLQLSKLKEKNNNNNRTHNSGLAYCTIVVVEII